MHGYRLPPGPCGSNVPVIQRGYCQKVLVEEFCKGPEEELVHPSVRAVKSPIGTLGGATSPLFVKPGEAMGGRQMPYSGVTHAGKAPPRILPGGVIPISQNLGAAKLGLLGTAMGSYGSSTMGHWLGKMNAARGPVSTLHEGLLKGLTGVQLAPAHGALGDAFDPEKLWVGDGSDTPANRIVNSCGEFAYQRWYDFNHFKDASKALGRNYRGIFQLATDPASKASIEKPTLKQFAIGTLPLPWPKSVVTDATTALPRNVFFVAPSISPSVPAAKRQQILDRIAKYSQWNGSYAASTTYITLKGAAGRRFELHHRLRDQLEAKYHLSDDALDERQARQDAYAELIATREELKAEMVCAVAPQVCCDKPPVAVPNTVGDLLSKLHGKIVANPDPGAIPSNGVDVGPIDTYVAFRGALQLGLSAAAWNLKAGGLNKAPGGVSPNIQPGLLQQGTQGGLKHKAPPGAAAVPIRPPPGQGPGGQGIVVPPVGPAGGVVSGGGNGGNACYASHTSKLPRLRAALAAVEGQLSDMVVSEFDLADGCLEDPGTNLGNSCDWSYEKFARFAMTYFDENVEADFKACNEKTHGAFATVRNPDRQGDIWPCEVRHDFGVDQLDTQYFMDATDAKFYRKACDVQRAQLAVDAYLKTNAETVKHIPVDGDHIGQSSGDGWSTGDKDTLAAYVKYDVGWSMRGGYANKKTDDGAWCHPAGAARMGASAGFYFFGSDVKVLDAGSDQDTDDDAAFYDAHAQYADLSSLRMTDLFPPVPRTRLTAPISMPLSEPPHLLGNINYDFWFAVGPIPVHVFFGATATAGIDLKDLGSPTLPGSCADTKKAIEGVPLSYAAGTQVEPWARADAYADASVDLGVADAGLHLDLLLLRLGLPTGVATEAKTGAQVKVTSGSTLTADALEGRLSAYVKVGVSPLSKTWEVTVFAYDGIHDAMQLFGSEATFPLKLATWTAQSKVDPGSIQCISAGSVAPGHPYCLRNPTEVASSKTACATFAAPAKMPDFPYVTCGPYYNLRGPTN
jgi:hypothetical protein